MDELQGQESQAKEPSRSSILFDDLASEIKQQHLHSFPLAEAVSSPPKSKKKKNLPFGGESWQSSGSVDTTNMVVVILEKNIHYLMLTNLYSHLDIALMPYSVFPSPTLDSSLYMHPHLEEEHITILFWNSGIN